MKIVFFVFPLLICAVGAALLLLMLGINTNKHHVNRPQHPEINDQFEHNTELQTAQPHNPLHTEVENPEEKLTLPQNNVSYVTESNNTAEGKPEETALNPLIRETLRSIPVSQQPSLVTKLYTIITTPIIKFIRAPKVVAVMSNVGTCLVNGAMELISFYFPAPLIPLIASAAGLIIPFEPVVMLREKMPVASYRRAFQKAVNGFMGTFDQLRYEDDDPYMKRRFNRRFLAESKEVKEEKSDLEKIELN